MRFIALFLIGTIGWFFLGEVYSKLIKKPSHAIVGIFIILLALTTLLFGYYLIDPPFHILLAWFLLGNGTGLILHHLLSKGYILAEIREKRFIREHDALVERFLEILPGALTWIALTSPIWLSFSLPFAVAYFIILADAYWLFSALKIAVLLVVGYYKMEYAKKQPWQEKLAKDFPDTWKNYYHLILLPRYNEGVEILGPSIDAVINSNFPKEQIFLAVGLEERAKLENTQAILDHLKKQNDKIGGIFTSVHPAGLDNEIPGPATNRNWMMKNAVKELEKRKIDPKNVIVTTLDSDFVIHHEFLAGALHKYLSTPEDVRDKRTYTGVFLYYNNYWESPAPMRLIAVGTSFWQLAEMVGSDKYMNFASMSINMQSLLDIGLWLPNKVNDDSGFFWKAYFHFKGDYKVIPHFIPITADTVLDVTLRKTFQNQYLQLKRWAYGVEHVPYIFRQYFAREDLDFWDKTDKLIFALWGYLRWGTLALFVTFAGFFIPLINKNYNDSVLAINVPIVSSWMLTIAFFGLLSTVFVHEKTVPPRPKNWTIVDRIWSYIQWLLLPIIMITISTIPAIDAQTSLMLGRYLEFRTTNKVRTTETLK